MVELDEELLGESLTCTIDPAVVEDLGLISADTNQLSGPTVQISTLRLATLEIGQTPTTAKAGTLRTILNRQ